MSARVIRYSAILVAALLAGIEPATAQSTGSNVSKVGTSAAAYLQIPIGAPAIAMGGAFVSVADDATSLYWNAAGSALLNRNELVAVHTNWIADTRFDYGAFVLPLGDAGSFGFSVTSLSMDDMKVRTVDQPEGTGEYFSAGDLAVGVTYARKLSDRFAIGFTGKYLRQSIWHESAEAFALDVGTTFRTDMLGGLVIGATFSNFGTKMTMSGIDARQFVRIDPTKTGSTDQVPTAIEMQSWDLPLQIQFGVSTKVIKSDDYQWIVALDAIHASDNDESMNIGTEFGYREILFLRGGFQSLFLNEAEGGLSLGVGLASGSLMNEINLMFDYAYRDMGRLESVHTFSLGIMF